MTGLDLDLTAEARAAIDGHVRLLLAWNAAINLTAIRDPAGIAVRHVLDSLSAMALVRGADRLLDLGSGGGFPGLPLAAALPVEALLVDSIAKKTGFLATVATAIGLADRVRVATSRAERLAGDPDQREAWPLVTARAVGELADLVELALPLLAPGGRLVAWKRGDLAVELAAASRAAAALGGATIALHPAGLPELDGHVLVEVRRTGPSAPGYPRDPAVRRRRPW